jgi:pyruvate dehydrogenase E2 component (dihydrolipoamide acetyltransferase)
MSVIDVKVPDIGDYKDVPIIEVHVKAGDKIKPDDPLVTLESDKAAMEVPAPQAGEIAEVLVRVGDKVSEGSALVRLASESNGAAAQPAAKTDEPSAPKAAETAEIPKVAPPGAADDPGEPPTRVPLPLGVDFGDVHASPSVRRLARELDIDLTTLKGSGEKGRITKEDVKRALGGAARAEGPAFRRSPRRISPSTAPSRRKRSRASSGSADRTCIARGSTSRM